MRSCSSSITCKWLVRAATVFLLGGNGLLWAQSTFEEGLALYKKKDYQAAVEVWTPLAEAGGVRSQYALGLLYADSEVPDADKARSVAWFQEAANQGHVASQFNLGLAYWNGSGVGKSRQKAAEWWRKAAEAGSAVAQYNLGTMYFNGEGVDYDFFQAVHWFVRSAGQSYEKAEEGLESIKGIVPAWFEPTPAPVGAQLVYVQEQADVRPAPDKGPVLDTVQAGTPVWAYQASGDWTRVGLPGGVPVWVYGRYVSGSGTNGVITGDNVRIRSLPSTAPESIPLGLFDEGTKVTILGSDGDWVNVLTSESRTAWLRTSRLRNAPASTKRYWYVEWLAHGDRRRQQVGSPIRAQMTR